MGVAKKGLLAVWVWTEMVWLCGSGKIVLLVAWVWTKVYRLCGFGQKRSIVCVDVDRNDLLAVLVWTKKVYWLRGCAQKRSTAAWV